MGCTTSIPPEHDTKYSNGPSNITETQINATNHNETKYNDTASLHATHDSCDNILSSPGSLEIPDTFKKWFPSDHAHKDIRKLFKWKQEIGHGITGSVHEIEYNQKTYAIKQISKNDEFGRMLFTTEARILSKLKHCGIIGYIDMFFDDKYYYIILEKADCDLHSILKKNGYLSEKKTRNITYSLLKTLSYMHQKNVVHRDLKPENIVFMDNDINNPKLIDFSDAEIAKNDKIFREFVGTVPYMSPERLEKHKGWQLKKSDIWAIAVIAYEMYCGIRCFKGDSQKQVFGRILRGEWEWPQNRKPSKNMRDFIDWCLKHDANDRPSADEALKHEWFINMREEDKNEKKTMKEVSEIELNDNQRER